MSEGELPEGWRGVAIESLVRLINGFHFKPTQWTPSGLPIIRIQNLNDSSAPFNHSSVNLPDQYRVRTGDLLFAWSGTPATSFGAHIWKGPEAWLNQHIFRILFDESTTDKRFLRLAINQNLAQYIHEAHGGAGLAHITKGKFEKSFLSLPPLAEQKRIAAKVEELLTSTNAARERLVRVTATIARLRETVLEAAYSGDLTDQWRPPTLGSQRHISAGTLPSSWRSATISELGRVSTGTTPPKSDSKCYGGEIPFFKPTDLDAGYNVTAAREFLTKRGAEKARLLVADSVLVTCIGATIGKTGLSRVPGATNQQINAVEPDTSVCDPRWLYWAMTSRSAQDAIRNNASETTLPILNKSRFQALQIHLPPLPEQHEIVRRVEALFVLADGIEGRVAVADARSQKLTQSILAKAFRGELLSEQDLKGLRPEEKAL